MHYMFSSFFSFPLKFSVIIAIAQDIFLLKKPEGAHEERVGLHLHRLNVSKHESVRKKMKTEVSDVWVLQYRVCEGLTVPVNVTSHVSCGDSHA